MIEQNLATRGEACEGLGLDLSKFRFSLRKLVDISGSRRGFGFEWVSSPW